MAPAEANSFRFFTSLCFSHFFVEEAGGDKPFAFYSPTEVLDFGLYLTFWLTTCVGWITWFRLSALRVWISSRQQTAEGAQWITLVWIPYLWIIVGLLWIKPKEKGPEGPCREW